MTLQATHDSPAAAIECRGLSRAYGPIRALEDLNLSVPYGSIFGFLGRNGAGKTTTIRLLTGLAQPTSGSAWVAGNEITQMNSLGKASFGYLPQEPNFYRWMTPVEYLGYTLDLFGYEAGNRKARIAEMLDLVGLSDAARRRIAGFSGGMLQRLGIAQALIHNPPVLFLDEPTSALDPAGRYEVLDLIAKLRGRVTVFLSTHILNDVERICDRVAIIHKGKLILESGREELIARYAVNVAEVEVDVNDVSRLPDLIRELEGLSWVEQTTLDSGCLRVSVKNLEQGKRELLPVVARQGLALLRYEWVHPSLEEIFLEVSA